MSMPASHQSAGTTTPICLVRWASSRSTLELNENREIMPIIKRRNKKQNNSANKNHQQNGVQRDGTRVRCFECLIVVAVRHRSFVASLQHGRVAVEKSEINKLENFIKMRSPLITLMRSTFPPARPNFDFSPKHAPHAFINVIRPASGHS